MILSWSIVRRTCKMNFLSLPFPLLLTMKMIATSVTSATTRSSKRLLINKSSSSSSSSVSAATTITVRTNHTTSKITPAAAAAAATIDRASMGPPHQMLLMPPLLTLVSNKRNIIQSKFIVTFTADCFFCQSSAARHNRVRRHSHFSQTFPTCSLSPSSSTSSTRTLNPECSFNLHQEQIRFVSVNRDSNHQLLSKTSHVSDHTNTSEQVAVAVAEISAHMSQEQRFYSSNTQQQKKYETKPNVPLDSQLAFTNDMSLYSRISSHLLPQLPIGFVAGLIGSASGVGGAIILVPLLVYFTKIKQRNAAGIGLACSFFTSVFGSCTFALNNSIHWPTSLTVGVTAALVIPFGAKLSGTTSDRSLQWIVSIAFILLAPLVFFKNEISADKFSSNNNDSNTSTINKIPVRVSDLDPQEGFSQFIQSLQQQIDRIKMQTSSLFTSASSSETWEIEPDKNGDSIKSNLRHVAQPFPHLHLDGSASERSTSARAFDLESVNDNLGSDHNSIVANNNAENVSSATTSLVRPMSPLQVIVDADGRQVQSMLKSSWMPYGIMVFGGSFVGFINGCLGFGGGISCASSLMMTQNYHHLTYSAITGTTLSALSLPSLVGSYSHYRLGHFKSVHNFPALILGVALGAVSGAELTLVLPESVLLKFFGAFLLLTGVRSGAKLVKTRHLV